MTTRRLPRKLLWHKKTKINSGCCPNDQTAVARKHGIKFYSDALSLIEGGSNVAVEVQVLIKSGAQVLHHLLPKDRLPFQGKKITCRKRYSRKTDRL